MTAMKTSYGLIVIWLLASLIAMLMAMQLDTAAIVDGRYIPISNDSFYHARRIIDAAISERGFYQFDHMIHVPEGSWLNWPWGYDYLMSLALSLALWIKPSLEPMAFLAHIPVAWVFVNVGLLALVARQAGLSLALTGVALLAFALLPLNQVMHGLGNIDHHYLELTFVLATLWSGLRFFGSDRTRDAIVLGAVLGVAPAFHNGLFILQVPLLAGAIMLWLRDKAPASSMLYAAALSLIVATLLIVLPSAPFWAMQFEFWTLSLFHCYVAIATAVCLAYTGRFACTPKSLSLLALLAGVMAIPLLARLTAGAAFLAGDVILLDTITEVRSPFAKLQLPRGLELLTGYYSWLIFLAPLLFIAFAMRIWKQADSRQIYLAVFAVFGTALMLTQSRLNPFGTWVLIVGSLLFVQEALDRYEIPPLAGVAGSLLALALAFQPPLRKVLFHRHPPALSIEYAITHSLFLRLGEVCAERGGTVLANNDDGHFIRYHSDCSVIINNFLLTPLHEKKILEARTLLQMTPEQFLAAAPHVKYLFVRMYEIFEPTPDGYRPRPVAEIAARNAPLFVALTFTEQMPDGYRLIDELRVEDDRDFAYARIVEVLRDE